MTEIVEKLRYITSGGIEAFVFEAAALINGGPDREVNISVYSDCIPESERFIKMSGKKKIKILCPKKNYYAVSSKPLRYAMKWNDFRLFCLREKPDTVHIHMGRPYDYTTALAARASGIKKIILHSHTSRMNNLGLPEKLLFPLLRAVCCRGCKLLACSEDAGKFMFGAKNRFTVVKNGIDTDKFRYDPDVRGRIRRKLNIEDKLVIGHIGRIAAEKNHAFLLDVFSALLKRRKDAVLIIAGEGRLAASLKEKAGSLGISDRVIFTGAVSRPEEIYQAMDCFVFPSHFEGLGVAAVEAQCSGLPVICSDKVPAAAAVTELCSFMSLDAPAEQWAEHIVSRTDGFVRRDRSEKVRASGYDAKDTARLLEEIYLGKK